jgi:glycyl-tRNA synthetase
MADLMDKIVSLSKRRGIIFPSSQIYSGLGSIYDYGHFGVLLKNNVKKAWWTANVFQREDIVGLDSAVMLHPKVWQASGHLSSFTDPLIECKSCHQRFRADHLFEGRFGQVKTIDGQPRCPACHGELTEERKFNLMFKTHIGPVEDSASEVYLRPETAQGIFINFEMILKTYNKKIPFGIAQIGKAFRNEITPGNFTFRMREFEQMEIEYFVEPGTDEKWHKFWLEERMAWYKDLGIKEKNLRLRPHSKEELSHYSKATYDIEYLFPWGWGELEGIANRTDFDLKAHQKFSGADLSYFDEEIKKSYLPYVIEPSGGVDRTLLAFLIDAYSEDKDRIFLKLDPRLAPVKIAVFPLLANKPELVELARKIFDDLRTSFACAFDDRGNIGKRYYAQDEVGTCWCLTVDFQSLKDETITVRDRDTTRQERIKIDKLRHYFLDKLKNSCFF